jgi:hypothetical protein
MTNDLWYKNASPATKLFGFAITARPCSRSPMNWTTTAHLGNVTAGGSPLSDPFEMGVGARRGHLSIKES